MLRGKNGQENKNRGEIQIKIAFTVKSGSLLDLSKKEKHRLSVGQLSHTASNISECFETILKYCSKILICNTVFKIFLYLRWKFDEHK